MPKLELTLVCSDGSRNYYLVNGYLPVMCHMGWNLVEGKYSFQKPPFVLVDSPGFETVEEAVEYYNNRIAPQKVKLAKALIKFYEETNNK